MRPKDRLLEALSQPTPKFDNQLLVLVAPRAIRSFASDLKMNQIEHTRAGHCFSFPQPSAKLSMAIRMLQERYGSNSYKTVEKS